MDQAIRPCPYCGTHMANPQQVTCKALACKRKQNAKRSLERYYLAKQGGAKEHQCKVCSSAVQRAHASGPWPSYCSDKCRNTVAAAAATAKSAANRALRVQRQCGYCSTPLPADARPYRKFCDATCGERHRTGVPLRPKDRTCVQCGAAIESDAPLGQIYCASKCKGRATYRRHASRFRAIAAQWRRDNKAYYLTWQAEYRRENAEKRKAIQRAAYAADPLRWKNARDLRRSRMRNHPDSVTVSARDWVRLLRRHNHACVYCGSRDQVTMEHVVPISRGGRHGIGNILPACWPCNQSKGDKLIVEWRRVQRWMEASSHAVEAVIPGRGANARVAGTGLVS